MTPGGDSRLSVQPDRKSSSRASRYGFGNTSPEMLSRDISDRLARRGLATAIARAPFASDAKTRSAPNGRIVLAVATGSRAAPLCGEWSGRLAGHPSRDLSAPLTDPYSTRSPCSPRQLVAVGRVGDRPAHFGRAAGTGDLIFEDGSIPAPVPGPRPRRQVVVDVQPLDTVTAVGVG